MKPKTTIKTPLALWIMSNTTSVLCLCILNDLEHQLQKNLQTMFQTRSKKERLQEIVAAQQKHGRIRNEQHLGKTLEVLIEKSSKKSEDQWSGRAQQNTVVVFPKEQYKVGDFVLVNIESCTSATLIGTATGYGPTQHYHG